jgi:hypothetical protein
MGKSRLIEVGQRLSKQRRVCRFLCGACSVEMLFVITWCNDASQRKKSVLCYNFIL